MSQETKIIKSMEFPTIVCCDLQGWSNKVIEKHQRERDSEFFKICNYGGDRFLEICISVFDIDDTIPKVNSL